TASAADNPVTDVARAKLPEHERDIMGAFKALPEEKYDFRPTPELMRFRDLALHITSANFFYCRALSGVPPGVAFPKPTAPKAELVAILQKSFDYCRPVIDSSKDAALGETIPLGPEKKPWTRALILIELLSGMDHHYGQAAGYLRLNGIVPPTATSPAPQ